MGRSSNGISLGVVLRRRRYQLNLTQAQVAAKAGCRPNYIAYLESDTRRPSAEVIRKLGKALDLDARELFFLAHPQARAVIAPERPQPGSAWERFKANRGLHARHGITRSELRALEGVAALGQIRSERDLLFVLQVIRQALAND